MTEYLITVTSSTSRLLKATRRVAFSNLEAAQQYAINLLERHRTQYIGGDQWDTWRVAVLHDDAFTSPIVAQGYIGRH